MTYGTLYLIPTLLGEGDIAWVIPTAVKQCIADLSYYIVENPKAARKFLRQVDCNLSLQEIKMQALDEHTQSKNFIDFLAPLLSGNNVGLLSEAGCPAVADPGAGLIRIAHQRNIRVVPLVGPSSVLLALMASGLNGQRFMFHGYLPVERNKRIIKIIQLERESVRDDQTQIFIETPYRNQRLLEALIQNCQNNTNLCIASNITLANEQIRTKTVKEWKQTVPKVDKELVIFLLHG
ncbi:MAG: SAM-dependent methyltransferase [Nitrosospira sp.]|nr:SAM-dependent methyltransferase [Nitrosospira sp.]MBI0407147.1 SAM-dependent methyltransferase [Nitrosospira sp.]MBI0415655.1 SAM-dependent methyltransferase [Nitrosospira sp.]MBI0416323.1 SAM-dependent methyltransferase [Nitrosospira sp.]MBI0418095.1 SAM-dependent methyltransferase [Nitrosospira sp.]